MNSFKDEDEKQTRNELNLVKLTKISWKGKLKRIFCVIIFISFNLYLFIDAITTQVFLGTISNDHVIQWIQQSTNNKIYAILVVIGMSVLATLVRVPGLVLFSFFGYISTILFGLVIGNILVSFLILCGLCIGSLLSFSVSRFLKRKEKSKKEIFSNEQLYLLLTFRLSSLIPKYKVNYKCGKLGFSFLPFLLSNIAYLPLVSLCVFIGGATVTFSNDYDKKLVRNEILRIVLLPLGILALIVVYLILVLCSKRKLSRLLNKQNNFTKSEEANESMDTKDETEIGNDPYVERDLDSDRFHFDLVQVYGYIEEMEMEAVLVESRDDQASKSQLHISSSNYSNTKP